MTVLTECAIISSLKVRELEEVIRVANKKLLVTSWAEQVGLTDGVLVFRPKAAEMLELSKSYMGQILYGDVVKCDLAGVLDCSSSFVDEFIIGWQRIVNQVDNAMLILANVTSDVRYTIESALNQRNKLSNENIVLIIQSDRCYEVLGNKVEKNVCEVFALLSEGSHITARLIADRFNLELNSAGNRLKKLYDAHMAMRIEQSIDAGGKYEYYIPTL